MSDDLLHDRLLRASPVLPHTRPLAERVRYELGLVQSTPINQISREVSTLARLLSEQQAEIAKLTRYLADAELRESALEDDAARSFAERDSLRRDLEACKVDAERYRWLRDFSTDEALFYLSVHETYAEKRFKPAEVDAYIDALAAIGAARARGEG